MSDVWEQPWFWPAAIVVLGLPIALLILTELSSALERRGNPAAKVVRLIRNFALPLGALLLLLSQLQPVEIESNWTKLVATFFGFVLIIVLLNGLNVALFATAERGSWRERMPSIFIDLIRLVIIVVCLALLFSWVWQADVGGLFTALGVSSIVIGLALQNAAGSVVSGLLLLFEQPFQLGDWLDTAGNRGRVVEVNWRAVHIDTGNGVLIIPTASLAGSSFTNLSRSGGVYSAQVTLTFSSSDAPHAVMRLIRRTAQSLPMVVTGGEVAVQPLGAGKYATEFPVTGPAVEAEAISQFQSWLWYGAQRAELSLDGTAPVTQDREELTVVLRRSAATIGLTEEEVIAAADEVRLERYGLGETLLTAGEVPEGIRLIVSGQVALSMPYENGELPFSVLGEAEAVGLTAFTRQASAVHAAARSDVTVLAVPASVIDSWAAANAELARNIGRALDNQRQLAEAAVAARESAVIR